jgi:hypothetical protein
VLHAGADRREPQTARALPSPVLLHGGDLIVSGRHREDRTGRPGKMLAAESGGNCREVAGREVRLGADRRGQVAQCVAVAARFVDNRLIEVLRVTIHQIGGMTLLDPFHRGGRRP